MIERVVMDSETDTVFQFASFGKCASDNIVQSNVNVLGWDVHFW